MDEQTKLRIRPFRRGDASKIITWCKSEKAFFQWSAGILGEYPLTFEKFVESMGARDESDSFFPFVAFDESGVVGFFILRRPGESIDELRFGFVIVSPEIRGKGYGKEMLRLGSKYAFEIYGAKEIGLGVFENNQGAFHCYKAVGFTENGATEDYEILGEKWKCVEMSMEKNN